VEELVADLPYYISPLAQEIREQGSAQGRALGIAQSRAEDVLLVLDVRGICTTSAVRNRITACLDSELLRQWLRRAVLATTAEEIFGDDEPAGR
jgi:hypothetical protein